MKRRRLLVALGLGILSGSALGGYALWRSYEADALFAEAEARLSAPLAEAPELDRIQASTAESLLGRAIELGRDDRETDGLRRYAQALVHLERGDLVFATTMLESARQSLGETPDVQVLGAEILRRKTQHVEARAMVEEALDREPSHRRALLLRADLDLDRGEGHAALSDLERLVSLEPDAACVHNRLAIAYELVGDLDRAERHLSRATELGPEIVDGWINLGRIRERQGRFEDAERAFDRALGAR
jgi:tetratricopeptide (TPR) repeat protein